MSEKIRLVRKIGFQNTFNTKCINVIFDGIGPLIILRSIFRIQYFYSYIEINKNINARFVTRAQNCNVSQNDFR